MTSSKTDIDLTAAKGTPGPLSPANLPADRTTREVVIAMSGLLLGMFVAMLASTVVSTALPKIIADLGGGQSAYTWVVTASLLATTVTTPVWGKLADLTNRKLLVQLSLVIFVVGSALAGFSQDSGTLIAFRILQGIGTGGMTALVQIVMADIVSPRERGRYMGLIGAVMAVATIGGPLLGGFVTDAWGWRWNFYIAMPVAVVAIVVLQRTLHVKRVTRKVTIDYLGTALLAGGASLLLIWVSLAGNNFAWASTESLIMVSTAVVLLAVLVLVEFRSSEPIIPMTLFRSRTFTLAVVASVTVGVAMFGTSVFLAQYMQLARGATPTESGLMTSPMIIGVMLASTIVGTLISKRGYWKSYVVTGTVAMTIGLALMGTVEYDTAFWLVAAYMLLAGAGVGMVMQNMVLIVQNDADPRQIGVASSGVSFFRGLGGAIGVSAMGGILGTRIASLMVERQGALAAAVKESGDAGKQAAAHLADGTIPDIHLLPAAVGRVVESVFGTAISDLFLISAPLGLIAIVAAIFMPNKPLGHKTTEQRIASGEGGPGSDQQASGPDDVPEAEQQSASGQGAPEFGRVRV